MNLPGPLDDAAKELAGKVIETGKKAAQAAGNAMHDLLFGADIREAGLTGAEIYEYFHSGAGSASLWDAATSWKEASGSYKLASELIASAVTELGEDWTGTASNSAQGAIEPLKRDFLKAADDADKAAEAIRAQAAAFDSAKSAVHALSPTPPSGPGPVIGILPGLDDARQEYQQKSVENQRVYRQYVASTNHNVSALPDFERVPPGAPGPGQVNPLAGPAPGSPVAPQVRLPSVDNRSGSAAPVSRSGAQVTPAPVTQNLQTQPDAGTHPDGWTPSPDTRVPSLDAGVGTRDPGSAGVERRGLAPGLASFAGGGAAGSGSAAGGRSGALATPRPGAGPAPGRGGAAAPGRGGPAGASAAPAGQAGAPGAASPGAARGDDDREHTWNSRYPGPDPWELFGPDGWVPPAVIGDRDS